MKGFGSVKILTWLQICTITIVILFVWLYQGPHLAGALGGTRGVIDGIIYSADSASVLIDGQILKEGESIYGVRVVDIDRRIVTFERAGQRWSQRVRERPSEYWDDPEQGTEAEADRR